MVIKLHWIITLLASILVAVCYLYKDSLGGWVVVLPFLLGYFAGLLAAEDNGP